MSANEKAEVVIIVIKKILKWVAVGFAAILSIGLLIFSYYSFDDWYSFERHKQKVIVSASFDEKICSKEFPLLIKVINKSSKTILSINVSIDVTRNGFSSVINGYSNYDYDKIIKPEEGWGECWAVETKDSNGFARKYLDGKNMTAKVRYYSPTFEE
jgi:hypothetical protein